MAAATDTVHPTLKRRASDHEEALSIKKAKTIERPHSGSESINPTLVLAAKRPPEPEASFLVRPPDVVYIEDYLRPFVVTASGIPADTLQQPSAPYRATVTIYYDNSDIQVLDPSPIVEHTEHWVQSSATCPGQDATRRIHFIFEDVAIDYLGEYTIVASIFRPGDDIEGPAYLTTSCSTLVQVAPRSRRIRPKPLSKCWAEFDAECCG